MEICSSAKKWDECREGSGLAELADSKTPGFGMSCALRLPQAREEIQGEEGDRAEKPSRCGSRNFPRLLGSRGGVPR